MAQEHDQQPTQLQPPEAEDRPVNLQRGAPPANSGFLIVRVRKELVQAADALLHKYGVKRVPLITSVNAGDLDRLEQQYWKNPPVCGLSSYFRIDVRKLEMDPIALEAMLRKVPGVELVYREKTASDPSSALSEPYEARQTYLGPAPDGIDAHWAWQRGKGDGMSFIDVEQGWLQGHPDIPPAALPPICNDNRDGVQGYSGDHGAAVLGIVAGVKNAAGIAGIAPNLDSVGTASWFSITDPNTNVADTLAKILAANPLPDVVLIEVQVVDQGLPIETDPAVALAIQNLTAAGVIVVEAAGNGPDNTGNDLDKWDLEGARRLNRGLEEEFVETGAILVGAARAITVNGQHVRNGFSNYGSRVDCYAWGNSIVTAGYGNLSGEPAVPPYTGNFGGTSGAAPIIAGAALLVQSILVRKGKAKLTPNEMRNALSDPATGTPQHPSKPGNIGVMPDLKRVVQKLLQ